MTSFSLKTRIIFVLAAVQLMVVLAIGTVLTLNARSAIAVEVSSSLRMARSLVLATIGTLRVALPPEELVAELPARLVQPRHTRIAVFSPKNDLSGVSSSETPTTERRAPAWFSRLMTPTIHVTRIPVSVDGGVYGIVLISTFPDDEISEVWKDARDLFLLIVFFFVAQTLLFAWVVQRSLAPLAMVRNSLRDLTAGHLSERVEEAEGPDLGPLTRSVNALGDALERGEEERQRLWLRLVTRGDDERKAIARDLHDEFGPCIFGLKVEASAIRNLVPDNAVLRQHAENILSIACEIQTTNKNLLASLRPMAIGQIPLSAVLADLFVGLRMRYPSVTWKLDCDASLPNFDETTELTIYRIIQEGTTNALRHAAAGEVTVAVKRESGSILVQVSDDGVGLPSAHVEGNGLSGMRERVTAIGGQIFISRGSEKGTLIDVCLPPTPAT